MALVDVQLQESGLLVATLQRPEKRNALNLALLRELNLTLGEHLRRGGLRALVLRGAGSYFSAGADLEELGQARQGDLHKQEQFRLAMAEFIYLLVNLRTLPLSSIAFVEGGAAGGGVGLAAACQWVVATEEAQFHLPEARIGVFPFIIAPVLLRRLPPEAFLSFALEAQSLSAAEAMSAGLVDRIVSELPEPEELAEWPARPQPPWPVIGEAIDDEVLLAPYKALPARLREAARTCLLLHESMALPVAMRSAALELASFLQGGGGPG